MNNIIKRTLEINGFLLDRGVIPAREVEEYHKTNICRELYQKIGEVINDGRKYFVKFQEPITTLPKNKYEGNYIIEYSVCIFLIDFDEAKTQDVVIDLNRKTPDRDDRFSMRKEGVQVWFSRAGTFEGYLLWRLN